MVEHRLAKAKVAGSNPVFRSNFLGRPAGRPFRAAGPDPASGPADWEEVDTVVELEQLNDDEVRVLIEIEPERMQEALDEAFRKIAKRVRVPGFRPGKAPRPIVERAYGPQHLYEDALNELVPKAYSDAIEELKLTPYEDGTIEAIDPQDDKGVRVKARVLLQPAVTLPDYRNWPREDLAASEVDDAMVDAALDEERRSHATLVPGEECKESSVVELTGTYVDEDGKAGTIERTQVALDRSFPAFREALSGARAGDARQVPLDSEHPERTAHVTVEDVREIELPALDDAFAQEHGHQDLKEMREELANALRAEAQRTAEDRRRSALLDRVIADAEVRVPEVLVEREAHGMLHEQYGEAAHDHEADDDMRRRAEQQVRAKLVVGRILEQEGIGLTQAEFDGARQLLERSRGTSSLSEQEQQSLYGILLDEKLRSFLGTLGEEQAAPAATPSEAPEPADQAEPADQE